MSEISIGLVESTAFSAPYTSAIGQKEPVAHPTNCKRECPYGYNRSFCFPCMAKIVNEHRAARVKEVVLER